LHASFMLKAITLLKASLNGTFTALAVTFKWLQDCVIALTFSYLCDPYQ
jgi:hypothetical protein